LVVDCHQPPTCCNSAHHGLGAISGSAAGAGPPALGTPMPRPRTLVPVLPPSSTQRQSPTPRRRPAERSTSPALHAATTNPQHTRRSGCKAEWIPMRYGDTWVGNRRSEKPPGEEAHAVNCGPHSQKPPTVKNGGVEPPQANPSTSGTWTTPLRGGGHVSGTRAPLQHSRPAQQEHSRPAAPQ
jgi:hypothetical protein